MAAQTMQQLVNLSPQYHFKNALSLLKNEHIQEALQSIDAAIVFSGNSPFYIYQKIRIMFHLGAYKNCSQLIVSQLEYLYKYGSLYILCRSIDYFQQINHFNLEELTHLLKRINIPYCLAGFYSDMLTQKDRPFLSSAQKAMVQDDYPLCICYCDLCLKLSLDTKKAIYMKAVSYHMLGDLSTAMQCYRDYIKLNPNETEAYIHLGSILLEQGQVIEAITYFEKASLLEPTNPDYLSYIGECYLNAKKYHEALTIYRMIAKAQPNNLQNYFNLSFTYQKLHKNFFAKHYLKKASHYLQVK